MLIKILPTLIQLPSPTQFPVHLHSIFLGIVFLDYLWSARTTQARNILFHHPISSLIPLKGLVIINTRQPQIQPPKTVLTWAALNMVAILMPRANGQGVLTAGNKLNWWWHLPTWSLHSSHLESMGLRDPAARGSINLAECRTEQIFRLSTESRINATPWLKLHGTAYQDM